MQKNQLHHYDDILDHNKGTIHLLLGNGFSIACDPVFKYNNIFEFAKHHGLSKRVQALFAHFGTTNFELIARTLTDLRFSSALYEMLLEAKSKEILNDIQEVKDALISAIAQTHLAGPQEVDDEKRDSCVAFLKPYKNVFTTNYDLLLYWSTMQGHSTLHLGDGFRSSPEVPDADYVVFSKRLGHNGGIFYMHGAMHLFEDKGEVRKHCWNRSGVSLTANVLKSLQQDHFPLFVAEGESIQKLEHIQRSGYLWYCYQKLQSIESPLVVYGSSLGESDRHVQDAIAYSDAPLVWLGVHGGASSNSASHMEIVAAKLEQKRIKVKLAKPLEIKFYDLSTAHVWDTPQSVGHVKKPPFNAVRMNFTQSRRA
jgi:hypothetical protein